MLGHREKQDLLTQHELGRLVPGLLKRFSFMDVYQHRSQDTV